MDDVHTVIVTVNGEPSEEALKRLAEEIVRVYLRDKRDTGNNEVINIENN